MNTKKLAVGVTCAGVLLCLATAAWASDRPSDGPAKKESRQQDAAATTSHPPTLDNLTRTWTTPSAPSEEPAAEPPMKYGVAATAGDFDTGYLAQVKESGASVGYFYGQDPRWSSVAAVPEGDDIWMQTKATTKAAYEATLASFPRTRTGKVYLHYFNEPEDQIERGEFTLAQWQQRTDWLYEAIAESGLSYVVPSVEIMYWDLLLENKGTAGPARTVNNYLRPGVEAVGSVGLRGEGGEQTATRWPHHLSGHDAADGIGAWSRKVDLPVSVITGWAVDSAYLSDPVSLANRVNWTKTAAANLDSAGIAHMMWFDVAWSTGTYDLSSDPQLLSAWRSLSRG